MDEGTRSPRKYQFTLTLNISRLYRPGNTAHSNDFRNLTEAVMNIEAKRFVDITSTLYYRVALMVTKGDPHLFAWKWIEPHSGLKMTRSGLRGYLKSNQLFL